MRTHWRRERVRSGYESQLARIDRRLEMVRDDGADDAESAAGTGDGAGPEAVLHAELAFRRRVIEAERDELELLVERRKVSKRVADEVRSALDVDETTMRP